MNISKLLIIPIILTFLFSCGGPVDVEGDIFLVKGDGRPQPAAAKTIFFIPSDSKSLEDILIESYVSSVEDEAQANKDSIIRLCEVSTSLLEPELMNKNNELSQTIDNAKLIGTTDEDGSCSLINQNLNLAKNNAQTSQNKYEKLITNQKLIISSAKDKKEKLESTLRDKIIKKEQELYNDLLKDINIEISPRGALTITNNTPYRIKLTNDLCLQLKNELNEKVGSFSASILGSCSEPIGSYRGKGTKIPKNIINIKHKDSFGFSKGEFLRKGRAVVVPVARDSYNGGYDGNLFCRGAYTPAQKNKFTKMYGDKSKWPDLWSPDPTKGYTVIQPEPSGNYYRDSNACLINGAPGKFIALEDEIKTEESDGTITYTSNIISFKEQAQSFQYPEDKLIVDQINIIADAQKEIDRITLLANNNKFIAEENEASKLYNACTTHQNGVKVLEDFIAGLKKNIQISKECDLRDTNMLPSLKLVNSSDIFSRDRLIDVDYSINASYKFMKIFEDALYKTSTNRSGHFVMKDLPKGEYIIISNYADNYNQGIYITNQGFDKDTDFDLSNSTYFEIPSIYNLAQIFYSGCDDVVCSAKNMKNRLDLRYIEDLSGNFIPNNERTLRELRALCRNLGIDC
jgi:hypothetical protein